MEELYQERNFPSWILKIVHFIKLRQKYQADPSIFNKDSKLVYLEVIFTIIMQKISVEV